jgi:hypothetical protein
LEICKGNFLLSNLTQDVTIVIGIFPKAHLLLNVNSKKIQIRVMDVPREFQNEKKKTD